MKTVDLSSSINTRSMLIDAEYAIACAKAEGEDLIKFINGGGRGGASRRRALRAHLRNSVRHGAVKQLLECEKFSADDRLARYFSNLHPELSEDADAVSANPDVTFVRV